MDHIKLHNKLIKNLAVINKAIKKRKKKKGIDDQMVMSITLRQMKVNFKSVTSPYHIFSTTKSIYYKHSHHLITKHCDVNDAIRWMCDRGIDATKYMILDGDFLYIRNTKKSKK